MSQYKFVPNEFAGTMFNLSAAEYFGEGLTPLLESALGKESCVKYLFAQDPFVDHETRRSTKTSGEVSIVVNRDEEGTKPPRFATIGVVHRLG
jgi:hypothetical protein